MSAATARQSRRTVIPLGARVTALELSVYMQWVVDTGRLAEMDGETAKLLFLRCVTTHAHGCDADSIGLRRQAKLSGLPINTVRSRCDKLHEIGISPMEKQDRFNSRTGKEYKERTVYRLPVPPEVKAKADQIRREAEAKAQLKKPQRPEQPPPSEVYHPVIHPCVTRRHTLCSPALSSLDASTGRAAGAPAQDVAGEGQSIDWASSEQIPPQSDTPPSTQPSAHKESAVPFVIRELTKHYPESECAAVRDAILAFGVYRAADGTETKMDPNEVDEVVVRTVLSASDRTSGYIVAKWLVDDRLKWVNDHPEQWPRKWQWFRTVVRKKFAATAPDEATTPIPPVSDTRSHLSRQQHADQYQAQQVVNGRGGGSSDEFRKIEAEVKGKPGAASAAEGSTPDATAPETEATAAPRAPAVAAQQDDGGLEPTREQVEEQSRLFKQGQKKWNIRSG